MTSPDIAPDGATPDDAARLAGLEARFWALADDLLVLPDVTRSTMMGRPCLRVAGAYFASWERGSGAMIVKLSEAAVDDLVDEGRAEPFAPAGRRFREWAAIPADRVESWPELLDAAHRHVASVTA